MVSMPLVERTTNRIFFIWSSATSEPVLTWGKKEAGWQGSTLKGAPPPYRWHISGNHTVASIAASQLHPKVQWSCSHNEETRRCMGAHEGFVGTHKDTQPQHATDTRQRGEDPPGVPGTHFLDNQFWGQNYLVFTPEKKRGKPCFLRDGNLARARA